MAVEVQILDASTVTLPSGSVAGPLHTFADSVTVGSSTITSGLVVVHGGAPSQPFGSYTALQGQLAPVLFLGSLFLGFVFSRILRP